MGYKDAFVAAAKAKTARLLTPEYVEFAKKGDSVTGKFLSSSDVKSTLGEGTYKMYVFDTDDGVVKFKLGAATDTELANVIVPGGVYQIVFQGQVRLKGGHSVNKFMVLALADKKSEEITDNDVSF